MNKARHQQPPFTTATTTTMDAKQIIDILPSYISLYRNHSKPSPNLNSERSAILKWFAALSPSQRLAHLTIVDPAFTRLLLRMLSALTFSPHVTFFLLPDLPSHDPGSSHALPTLCTRRSHGLLARLAESNESTRRLRSSLLLFSSAESTRSSSSTSSLDTVAFTEGFVADVGKFVETMDRVSDSGFLTGPTQEWAELGNEWPEMGWLKAKGYYSVEAFVSNRVEVALRFGWLNSGSNGGGGGGGKRLRGVKLKEKAKSVVGLGFNVYWRKKGCVEWWDRLDDGVKTKVFRMVLGKTAKSLVYMLICCIIFCLMYIYVMLHCFDCSSICVAMWL